MDFSFESLDIEGSSSQNTGNTLDSSTYNNNSNNDNKNYEKQESQVTEDDAYKISEALTNEKDKPKLSKKTIYIIVFVIVGLVVVGVIVAVVLLLRKGTASDAVVTIIPTVSNSPHIPLSIEKLTLDSATTTAFDLQFDGLSTTFGRLLVQNTTLMSMVTTANNSKVQLNVFNYSVTPVQSVQAPVFQTGVNFGFGVFQEGNLYSAGLVVANTTIPATYSSGIVGIGTTTSDPFAPSAALPASNFNMNNFITTTCSSLSPTGSIFISVLGAADPQFFAVKAITFSGTVLPTVAFKTPIPVTGGYNIILYSTNQTYLSLLFFNTSNDTIEDLFIGSNGTTTQYRIPQPSFQSGIVGGCVNAAADTMITFFQNSFNIYWKEFKDANPVFVQTDYILLSSLSKSIQLVFARVDSTGTYFVIATNSETTIFGVLSNEKTIVGLYQIPLTLNISNLLNTGGPCSVETTSTSEYLYLSQQDTNTHGIIYPVKKTTLENSNKWSRVTRWSI